MEFGKSQNALQTVNSITEFRNVHYTTCNEDMEKLINSTLMI